MDASNLLPWQPQLADELLTALRRNGAALDGSETGVGKTYVALAVARELNVAPLVVCPKSVRSAWERAADYMGGGCYTVNYEMLRTGRTEWGQWETVAHGQRFVFDPQIPLIVWDEAHRCKGQNTLNAKTMIACRRQGIPALALSATAAQNPLDLRALGFLLGLHDGKSFYKFCRIFGCRQGEWGGLEFYGGEPALRRLHAMIYPDRGVRKTRDELGGLFPECQNTVELYDLPEAGEIENLYLEMREPLERLRQRMLDDADLEHPLTKLLRLRQKIELLKVPLFEELVSDALEDGLSPVVFVNFNETIDQLIGRLRRRYERIAIIRGGQSDSERQEAIDSFQRNECRIMIANGQAGGIGVSLHDLDGRFPRISFISPSYSAIQLIQTLGRIHRAGAKSKALQRIVLIAKTVEEKIHRAIVRKLDNISLINDNDLNDLFS